MLLASLLQYAYVSFITSFSYPASDIAVFYVLAVSGIPDVAGVSAVAGISVIVYWCCCSCNCRRPCFC